MTRLARTAWTLVALAFGVLQITVSVRAGEKHVSPQKRIPGGPFTPFYGDPQTEETQIQPFLLDIRPVTNAQFLRFVQDHPLYRRSRIARLFASPEYIANWKGDLDLGTARPREPVVFVSWFAARAYCAAQGARLPTESEWELAAQADETRKDAHRDPAFVQNILAWYSRPHGQLEEVMQRRPNVFGLYDMHGLIWEWVSDFNASLVSADDRARDDDQVQRVCGGAASGSNAPDDYAAFMRYAFRSSLKAGYAIHNLGFRCARSLELSS